MKQGAGQGFIWITLMLAAVLAFVPLPAFAALVRPAWVPLFVLCWVLISPGHCGLVFAWLAGLMMDLLHGSLLGQHALAMSCMALAVSTQGRFMMLACWWQQSCVVVLSIGLYELVVLCVGAAIGQSGLLVGTTLLAPVSSALLWPMVRFFLSRLGAVLALR